MQSVHLTTDKTADDFEIRTASSAGTVQACVINLVSDLVTQASYEKMTVKNQLVAADPERDIIKVAAVDRTHHPGKQFNGLIKGFGLKSGALASSTAWDSTAIIVVGAADNDMALAINRIRDLNGGVVVCQQGNVLSELALPIFGLMSALSLKALTEKTKNINRVLAELGVPFRDPLLTLSTLTSAAIPFVRICEEGLVGLKDGQLIDLVRS